MAIECLLIVSMLSNYCSSLLLMMPAVLLLNFVKQLLNIEEQVESMMMDN